MKPDFTAANYKKQINKVIDYIHGNLDRKLSMEELCAKVDFSPYHFHRIFTSAVGEPLAKYVTRLRMERAAAWLIGDVTVPISNIAYDCGFSSVNVFCRNFKKHFGMTAQEYRSKSTQTDSKNSQFSSKDHPNDSIYSVYLRRCKTLKSGGLSMNCTFEIKRMPALNIVYCRHHGKFDGVETAFKKLMQWAYPRGLVGQQMQLLGVYHDNPNITAENKLTSDAAMAVPANVKADGEMGQYVIPEGMYAVGRFEIPMDGFSRAWNLMFDLLAEHGCECTNGYHYELYLNNKDDHPQKLWVIDICIPVRAK